MARCSKIGILSCGGACVFFSRNSKCLAAPAAERMEAHDADVAYVDADGRQAAVAPGASRESLVACAAVCFAAGADDRGDAVSRLRGTGHVRFPRTCAGA